MKHTIIIIMLLFIGTYNLKAQIEFSAVAGEGVSGFVTPYNDLFENYDTPKKVPQLNYTFGIGSKLPISKRLSVGMDLKFLSNRTKQAFKTNPSPTFSYGSPPANHSHTEFHYIQLPLMLSIKNDKGKALVQFGLYANYAVDKLDSSYGKLNKYNFGALVGFNKDLNEKFELSLSFKTDLTPFGTNLFIETTKPTYYFHYGVMLNLRYKFKRTHKK